MDKIQIKCASCGQGFAVTQSYIGRMVECGSCYEKFKVEESTIIKQKKHYPGEKSESNAAIYAKSPNTAKFQDVSFQTASYQDINAEYVQPPKPLRTLMIFIGAIFILLFIALFLIGGREEGALKALDNTKRFILAGFVAITGSTLIIVGTRHKIKGLILSIVMGGSLLAMPFIFPEVINAKLPDISLADLDMIETPETNAETSSFSAKLEKYKEDTGLDKVLKARELLKEPDRLKALILRNRPDKRFQDLDPILSYLEHSLGLESTPLTYSYGREIDGEPVILITFLTETPLEQVFAMTRKFGNPEEMDEIRTALKVIEVTVNRDALIGPPTKFTTDESHPNYFISNLLELNSIDRDKQLNAAKRLQTTKLRGMQADISYALKDLISTKDHELSRQAIATLYHWTLPEYNTDQTVLEYAKNIAGTDLMHSSVMDYLADKDVLGSEEVLAKQWGSPKGYLLWENHLVRAKQRGETAVIASLPKLEKSHLKSAAFILSKVGTAESIPAINAIISKASEDNKKYFKAAIDEIKSRQ